jgi:hypothetical protein
VLAQLDSSYERKAENVMLNRVKASFYERYARYTSESETLPRPRD